MEYPIELVFGAACYAQRINGAYIKNAWPSGQTALGEKITPTNRSIMLAALAPTDNPITEEDMELGRKVRSHYQGLTFKILKNESLSEFERTALEIVKHETVSSNYHLAMICSFPSCHARDTARIEIRDRVTFAAGGYIGSPGSKVTLEVEVLTSFFSQKWQTNYVTAITEADQAIFFSFREKLAAGSKLKIFGTVKGHRENQTQLTRVKVLE